MYAASLVIFCWLHVLKTNCQEDWGGKWFPYNPAELVPDLPKESIGRESNNNCAEGGNGIDCNPSNEGNDEREEWKGAWFPGDPNGFHHIPMGIPNAVCDDGVSNLEIDYDGSPLNFTCYDDRNLYLPNSTVHPLHEVDKIPEIYHSSHYCMEDKLAYNSKFPTFGPHRPLWPQYGEYSFVPIQRWLHTLEHGGIVMLYHPCADKNEVHRLKHVVRHCLFRHVISASHDLTKEMPIVVLAWGHRLFMSKINPEIVRNFIKLYANKAPEKISRDGQYSLELQKPAIIISDRDDKIFCPTISM